MTHTLYLCYFGLREPLVQTQVLPYLREIAKGQIKVSLLTFEPDLRERWSNQKMSDAKQRLAFDNIAWSCLPYHKRPTLPATLFDIINGARFAVRLVRHEKVDVLHARTHVPLMMALIVKALTNCKIIFDIRGLIAEEYADAGVWREGSLPFRLIKRVERLGLKKAEQIVVLTDRMKNYLVANKLKAANEIEVVPCCVDFSRIERFGGEKLDKAERFELIYAGSVSGLYLLEEMGRFFLELKRRVPNAFFRVLTVSSPVNVNEVFGRLGIANEDFAVQAASPTEVLTLVKCAHLAISFRKSTFSQIAASPTKIPEYLAAGVPVIANAGIGDMDTLLEKANVGTILQNFNSSSLANAVDSALKLLEDESLAERCVETARTNFDLITVGGKNYLNVYKQIAQNFR